MMELRSAYQLETACFVLLPGPLTLTVVTGYRPELVVGAYTSSQSFEENNTVPDYVLHFLLGETKEFRRDAATALQEV